jgi:hypothetical protein
MAISGTFGWIIMEMCKVIKECTFMPHAPTLAMMIELHNEFTVSTHIRGV